MRLENIRFKAKRLDNSEWVEGDLLHAEKVTMIAPINGGSHVVDPSTVCQYTGLYDCNGVALYEHDIVEPYPFPWCEIVWSEENASFFLKDKYGKIETTTLGFSLSMGIYKFLRSKFDKEEKG